MDIQTFDFVCLVHATNQRGVTPAQKTQHTSDSHPLTHTHTHSHTHTHTHTDRHTPCTAITHVTLYYTLTRDTTTHAISGLSSLYFFYSLQQPFARRGGGFFWSAFVIPQIFLVSFTLASSMFGLYMPHVYFCVSCYTNS